MRAVQWTAVLILFVAVGAYAADWPVVYEEDFSSDPEWIDDDVQYHNYFPPFADDHAWRPEFEDYGVVSRNNIGDTPPMPYEANRYAYHSVPWTGMSFELTWDHYVVQTEWSGGVAFGMFDDEMWAPGGPPGSAGNGIYAVFGYPDQGLTIHLQVHAAGNIYRAQTGGWVYQEGKEYTCTLLYDSIGQAASLDVVDKVTGTTVASLNLSIPDPFTKPLDRLGTSWTGMGWNGYSGVNRYAIAEGVIDNVRLEMVPEPSILALMALGALGLLWRRKAKR